MEDNQAQQRRSFLKRLIGFFTTGSLFTQVGQATEREVSTQELSYHQSNRGELRSETRIRRVVTGRTQANKSVFLSVGVSPRIVTLESLPGFALTELWATDDIQTVPIDPRDPTIKMASFVPGPGGTRFRMVRFPAPQEIVNGLPNGFDPVAFRREYQSKAPGLAETHEVEDFGMHTTHSIDYVIVLSGEIWLELDDRQEVHLKPGDCVVQNGTRHAWHNRSQEPCLMACVLVGAKPQ